MSSRAGLQPLRATVPYQLHNSTKTPAQRWREAKPVETKTKARPPKPTLRRTLSLDTLVGPYLQGQWPKQTESQTVTCVNDKATQTPSSWTEETRGRRGGAGHKRSASWGSAEHLREVAKLRHSLQKRSRHAPPAAVHERLHQHQASSNIHTHMPGATQTIPLLPLSRLAPRLRRSVEGLNLELEGVFVSETAEEQHKILDVPDGHRAPAPVQRCSSGSQSDLSPSLLSPSQSPCPAEDTGMVVCGTMDPSASPPLYVIDAPSSSPLPNKTYAFQREPPEGCERVRVCEEAYTRGDYGQGEKKEKFRYATTLVFIQCIINALFARLLIQFFEGSKPDLTQSWLYAVCALSYLGAMVSSNSALQYVNYPTQVLGKSCKPIPVMILGVTILRKRYPMSKYMCVLLIVTGVALFLYKPNKASASTDEHVFGFGEMLLLLSLTLDGLTGVAQDHMRGRHQTGANHMMLNVNLWSTLMLGLAVLWTGEVWEFLSFADRYPSIIYNILLFGFTSALGQTFIFMTVVYFGPLTCSIVTTTRKFFTILGSVLLFGNVITPLQWFGTILVFLGLGLDAKYGKLIPLFIFIGGGCTMSLTYLARLALRNPDVSWDRTNNPEPYNKLGPNDQYK
ncbi:solute carrier family 35 member B1, partial [Clarias magur]